MLRGTDETIPFNDVKPSLNGMVSSVPLNILNCFIFFCYQIINLFVTYMSINSFLLPVTCKPVLSGTWIQKVTIFDSI